MKKSIIISAVALLLSIGSFAQNIEKRNIEHKAPSMEQMAQRRADYQRKSLELNDAQHKQLYKLYLKQAKQHKARMEQMKKEHEKFNSQLRKIFSDEQWAKYEKMQKRAKMRRQPIQRPGQPKPALHKEQMKKGPQIERPQGKHNNMYINKGKVKELK
ncbi:MAG: hypothetical protein IIY05_07305 [Alistipes sp.]|nr:hypothetical protein [Alistipes sp.]